MLAAQLNSYRDPSVRDLVWVMAAPGLLDKADWLISDEECLELLKRATPQLLALDQQPRPLHTWIAARNPQRLGRYFEVLIAYWLTYLIKASWFVANQVVKSGSLVCGEYDLLWRDAAGHLNHWEVSVKFYLRVENTAGFAGYIGTLTRDRLDLKVAQLRDKQLKLSQTPAGASALMRILPEASPGEPVRARALFKGWLFYHRHTTILPAAGLGAAHSSGWWMRWSAEYMDFPPKLRWRVLDRLAWLSPAIAVDPTALLDEINFLHGLAEYFTADGMPLLVAGFEQGDNGWQEVTRGFILPITWGKA